MKTCCTEARRPKACFTKALNLDLRCTKAVNLDQLHQGLLREGPQHESLLP